MSTDSNSGTESWEEQAEALQARPATSPLDLVRELVDHTNDCAGPRGAGYCCAGEEAYWRARGGLHYAVGHIGPALVVDGRLAGTPVVELHLTMPGTVRTRRWVDAETAARLVERADRGARPTTTRGLLPWARVVGVEQCAVLAPLGPLVACLQAVGYRVACDVAAQTQAHVGAGFDHVQVRTDLDPRVGRPPRAAAIASADEVCHLVRGQRDLDLLDELLSITPPKPGAVVVLCPTGLDPHTPAVCARVALERGWCLAARIPPSARLATAREPGTW